MKEKNSKPTNFIETFESFVKAMEESEAYDEPRSEPEQSIKSSDYEPKDKLNSIAVIADNICNFLEDGQQLEPEQISSINNMFEAINKLKRQVEDREEVKQKEEELIYSKIDNPNL